MGALLILYSVLHLLVDGVCAYAMVSRFIPAAAGGTAVLIYNFCAFALQMPIGVILDRIPLKKRVGSGLCAFIGVCLTLAGALCSPVLLGLGNALYHIGAGTDIMRRDAGEKKLCSELGAFVAPGAIGLFLGRLLAGSAGVTAVLPAAAVLMLVPELYLLLRKNPAPEKACLYEEKERCGKDIPAFALCFAVVVLRSFTGLSVHFSAAAGTAFSVASVLAVAGGKWLGGVLGTRFGMRVTAAVSLLCAAALYCLSAFSGAAAVAALLLFNMTMPLTLYEPVRRRPDSAGFFFGLLTFGLFLGFVPVWAGWEIPMRSELLGALSCLLSLALLLPAFPKKEGSGCTI